MSVPTSSLESVLIQTSNGTVRGSRHGDVARFLGIPFAAPPVGPNRFELPRPHEPWTGELDATRFGPTPPQTPYEGVYAQLLPTTTIEGDEILNLNIWAPAAALAGGRVPVMVWVYGGALIHGANSWPVYDGSPFARDGVVFVAVNYRVGIDGFGLLEGAPDNRGLADIIAGLGWVQREIAAFGGDPAQVTVFGQSAGGALVSTLLASPAATGLFHKAIVMSAGIGPLPPAPARSVATAVAEDLGIPQTKAAFAGRPAAELVAAEGRAFRGSTIGASNLGHRIVHGDELLPEPVWTALEGGAGDDVPVLIGTTSAESRFWYAPAVAPARLTPDVVQATLAAFGIGQDVFELYQRNRPGDSAAAIYGALVLDVICRPGMNRFADRRTAAGAPTFLYEFAWPSPVLDMRAAHCMDLPFLYDNLSLPASRALVGGAAPQALADEVHGAFVRFAKTGDPGWTAWDSSRPVWTFDSPQSAIVNDPRSDERLAISHFLR